MITIIHGDDELASRNYFTSQKDEKSLTFDAENIQLGELEHSLSGSGLFENHTKIFIENLFTRNGIKNISVITQILEKFNKPNVFIWSNKLIPAKYLSLFPEHDSRIFKVPQNIWGFLDNIRPGSKQNVINFQNALKSTEPEIVFAMIVRQFRLMLGLLDDSGNSIDEMKRIAPWQRSKLARQASLFDTEKLKLSFKKLYAIDKNVKTGKTNLSLTQNIDIFLLEI